jgi:hypothetical protein
VKLGRAAIHLASSGIRVARPTAANPEADLAALDAAGVRTAAGLPSLAECQASAVVHWLSGSRLAVGAPHDAETVVRAAGAANWSASDLAVWLARAAVLVI